MSESRPRETRSTHWLRPLPLLAVLVLWVAAGTGCSGDSETPLIDTTPDPSASSEWDQMSWDQGSWG